MKQLLIIILISLSSYQIVTASHMMGGEITWECNGAEYVFTLKIYRDCNGVQFTSGPQTIDVSGHPTISLITAFIAESADISPPGCGYSCQSNTQQGAVEEYIFKSNPINLGNIPPPSSGWTFSWTLCCRNSTILNVLGPGSLSMTLRSKMFSYNGLSVTPCYNSSPSVAEKPGSLICSGYEYLYAQTAFDNELDSMSYHWDVPMNINQVIPYDNGYTVAHPMPGNISLDSHTGLITFFPPQGASGDFVTCVRIDEYRCGVKISEIYRDIQMGITGACSPVCGSINTPAFAVDTSFNRFTVLTDTVFPGDTFSFQMGIVDTNLNISCNNYQNIVVDVYGQQMENDSGMCLIPPCATVNAPLPAVVNSGTVLNFNWVTSCAHVASFNDCYQGRSLYQFVVNLRDFTCPAPAINNILINVVVQGPQIFASGDTLYTNFTSGTLQWYLDGVPIPGAVSNTCITTVDGVYSVVATTASGCSVPSAPFDNTCNISAIISGDLTLCPGENGELDAGSMYQTYQWYKSDGINPPQMIPGATGSTLPVSSSDANYYFSVVVTQGHCKDTSEQAQVQIKNVPPLTFNAYGNFILTGDSIFTVCSGDNMYIAAYYLYNTNIMWFNNGQPINYIYNILTVSDPGIYTMQGAIAGCPDYIVAADTSFNVEYVACTGISSLNREVFEIYPNPATNYIYIHPEVSVNFSLYDLTSRLLMYSRGNNRIPVDVEPGVYLYKIESDQGYQDGIITIVNE